MFSLIEICCAHASLISNHGTPLITVMYVTVSVWPQPGTGSLRPIFILPAGARDKEGGEKVRAGLTQLDPLFTNQINSSSLNAQYSFYCRLFKPGLSEH